MIQKTVDVCAIKSNPKHREALKYLESWIAFNFSECCLEFPSVDLPKRKLQFARVQNIQPDVTGFCAYCSWKEINQHMNRSAQLGVRYPQSELLPCLWSEWGGIRFESKVCEDFVLSRYLNKQNTGFNLKNIYTDYINISNCFEENVCLYICFSVTLQWHHASRAVLYRLKNEILWPRAGKSFVYIRTCVRQRSFYGQIMDQMEVPLLLCLPPICL